jgi:hypothetical protein
MPFASANTGPSSSVATIWKPGGIGTFFARSAPTSARPASREVRALSCAKDGAARSAPIIAAAAILKTLFIRLPRRLDLSGKTAEIGCVLKY